ncbi:hypothetical protein [Clostridium thermopalmarium]|uniref:Uncharacterized protein n=1 Tax=Clostridium thermopalmarium DSM 5974 TaxID=1121340 RepID=A0A2T0AZI5_9CLOT|nr:hypothetical protein [Clostridium thermopalmarium]PRR76632.1 hypothetical protein CPAL_03030 [Clostridium thermopalmarium DSM 5974]PVZ28255.1 hypothetical protein LX19_00226 [Clostridium thermopalmarium DSM 5974]
MQVINNNLETLNLQTSSNSKHIHRNMPRGQVQHDVSKMNSANNKEQMHRNCNMKGMHGDTNASAVAKAELNNKVSDSNIGVNINTQA